MSSPTPPYNHDDNDGMTKFAVDTSSPGGAKHASGGETCPLCGKRVQRHGNVVVCPSHGSEPFERR